MPVQYGIMLPRLGEVRLLCRNGLFFVVEVRLVLVPYGCFHRMMVFIDHDSGDGGGDGDDNHDDCDDDVNGDKSCDKSWC